MAVERQDAAEPRYPTVHVEVPAQDADEASAMLWELGATGVEERDASTLDKPAAGGALLVAHFDDEDRARIAAQALRWSARIEHIVGDEWRHRWKEFFKPTRIGERLMIRPSWEAVEPREGDVVLTLDPGSAFGTGTHETTRLVLMEIEARVRGGERVLDAGCGSGILAIGALLLGARDATAVDNDELAITATNENAEANAVANRVRASTTPVAKLRGRWDLVVANIESRVLLPMSKTLIAKVAPGGTLVLSGLLVPEEDEIRSAYGALRFVGKRVERDWIALTFEAPAAPAKKKAPPAKKKAPPAKKKTAKRAARR
ncbi:MAG: 50S ribosomal protein L11 methyltransferase [Myxococcota bacterium]|nr:50S ribosomal protein L11 methyltransferase [Myxococcota bacterium]